MSTIYLPLGIIFISDNEIDGMNTTQLKKPRGRPPSFDHEEALEKALQVFWTHGYEGASMAERMGAMGLNKPSIYAAFGNKEELFHKALQKYQTGIVAYVNEAIHEPTARQVVEKLLTKSVEVLTSQRSPRGCMIVQGALACGQGASQIQQQLIACRKGFENKLRQRFELAKKSSDLPKDANPAELAKYVATIHQGISVQVSSGATKEELMAVITIALTNWPVGSS